MTRLTADFPDLISLCVSLCDVCLATAILASIITLIESAFILGFPAERTKNAAVPGAVTVLKPLHGSEPELPARLAAFCRQDFAGPVQVLCGTRRSRRQIRT
jgi:ceramide glucosyltransferase